jgi:restriction endonuclease Mrr
MESASKGKTETSRIFAEILARFREHMGEENETIVPLLSYLKHRESGECQEDKKALTIARDKFNENYNVMIREHRIIQALVSKVEENLRTHPDELQSRLAEELLKHIELEEGFLYPAARASGEILSLYETVHNQK